MCAHVCLHICVQLFGEYALVHACMVRVMIHTIYVHAYNVCLYVYDVCVCMDACLHMYMCVYDVYTCAVYVCEYVCLCMMSMYVYDECVCV